jgi:hypothetical protein
MRKLYLVLLALTISVAMLAVSVVPVLAEKPTTLPDNKPVAWVDSAVNTNQSAIGDGIKTSHSLHVKQLADGTVEGVVEYHNYITDEKGHFTSFDQTLTKFYELPDGAKVAEVVAHVPRDGQPDGHIKYLIVDYGEPSTYDWHKVFVWLPDWGYPAPYWYSEFGPNPIPYKGDLDKPLFSGNANVTITDNYVKPPITGSCILYVNNDTYIHDMFISTQSPSGTITGTGGYPWSGPPYYAGFDWTLVGQITGTDVTFTVTYSNAYTAILTGTIGPDGSMSGGAGTGGVVNWRAVQVP